jgi:hypothetical protein
LSKPKFTAAIIADLRDRVTTHNQANPVMRAKLGDLKKVYVEQYRGATPAVRALRKVDEYLDQLVKASFDPDDHPRGQGGKFRSKAEQQAASDAADALNAGARQARRAAHQFRRAAHHAAHFAGFAEAPRPEDVGEVELPFPLPRTEAEHRALQYDNPAYAALTSDIIPENRYVAVGTLARLTGSAALASVAAGSLLRGKPNGLAAKVLRGTVRPAFRGLGVVVSKPPEWVGHAVARQIKNPVLSRRLTDIAEASGAAIRRSADAAGERSSAGLFGLGHRGMTALRDGLADWVPVPPPVAPAFAVGTAGLVGGAALSHLVHGTPIDPAVMAAAAQPVTYRVVRKYLEMDGPGLEKTFDQVELAKSGTADAVARAAERYFMPAGRRVLTAGASLAGAGIGAGVGTGAGAIANVVANRKDRGNPYHDAEGRFTSKTDAAVRNANAARVRRAAAIGAAIGALAGGGGAHLLMTRANRAAFAAEALDPFEDMRDKVAALHAKDNLGNPTHPDLIALESQRAAVVGRKIDEDPELRDIKAAVREQGDSALPYLKDKVRQEGLSRIADLLTAKGSLYGKFELPTGGPVSRLGGIRTASRAEDAKAELVKTLDGMSDSQFEAAMAPLTEEQANTLRGIWKAAAEAPATVERMSAAHLGTLDRIRSELKDANAAKLTLEETLNSASAVLDAEMQAHERGEHNAVAIDHARLMMAQAKEALKDGESKVKALKDALDHHLRAGPQIVSPISGKPVTPPTKAEQDAIRNKLEDKVSKKAHQAYDRVIDKRRAELEERYGEEAVRNAATEAHLGLRASALPRSASVKQAARDFVARDHEYQQALDDLARSQTELVNIRGAAGLPAETVKRIERQVRHGERVKEAEAAGKKPPRGPAAVEGMDDPARAKIAAAFAQIVEHEKAKSKAALALMEASRQYEAALISHFGPSQVKPDGRLSKLMRQRMMKDIERGLNAVGSPINDYLVKPSRAAFLRAYAAAPEKSKHFKAKLNAALRDLYRANLTRPTGYVDPKTGIPERSLDMGRLAMLVGSGAIGAGGLAALEWSKYLRSKLPWVGGDPQKMPNDVKIEWRHVDPVTGAGFVGVSAQDKTNPNDRVLLWGQRFINNDTPPIPVPVGASVSALKRRAQEDQQRANANSNGNSFSGKNDDEVNLGGMDDKTRQQVDQAIARLRQNGGLIGIPAGGNLSVFVRQKDDQTAQNEAKLVIEHLRQRQLNQPTPTDGRVWAVLKQVFSKQSKVLTRNQIFSTLTGFTAGGDPVKTGNPVLPRSEALRVARTPEEGAEATSQLLETVLSITPPQNDQQKASLRRAFAIIGAVKQVPDVKMRELFDRIGVQAQQAEPRGYQGGQPGGPHRQQRQAEPQPEFTTVNEDAVQSHYPEEGPADQLVKLEAHKAARDLMQTGHFDPHEERELATAVYALGAYVHREHEGFGPTTSVEVVRDALRRLLDETPAKGETADEAEQRVDNVARQIRHPHPDAVGDFDYKAFFRAVDLVAHQRKRTHSAADLAKGMPAMTSNNQGNPKPPPIPKALGTPKTPKPVKMTGGPRLSRIKADAVDVLGNGARAFAPPGTGRVVRSEIKQHLGDAAAQMSGVAAPRYKISAELPAAMGDALTNELVGHAAGAVMRRVAKRPAIGFRMFTEPKAVVSDFFGDGVGRGVARLGAAAVPSALAGIGGSAIYDGVSDALGGGKYNWNAPMGERGVMGAGNYLGSTLGTAAGDTLMSRYLGRSAGAAADGAGGELAAVGGAAAEGAAEGGEVGSALLPGLGTLGGMAAGSVAGALGEAIGHFGYQALAGYPKHTVHRILSTKLPGGPRPPNPPTGGVQQTASAAGETLGSTLGNMIGGRAAEGLAGPIGSIVGGTAASASGQLPKRQSNA